VLVHYIFLYQVATDLKIEKLAFEIWFNPTKKKYARLCKNIVRNQLAQYSWASASRFWGLPFAFQLLLLANQGRKRTEAWQGHDPFPFKRGATGAHVPFHNNITGNFMVYLDGPKTNLFQLFAHTEN